MVSSFLCLSQELKHDIMKEIFIKPNKFLFHLKYICQFYLMINERNEKMMHLTPKETQLLTNIQKKETVFWENPQYLSFADASEKVVYSYEDIEDAEARLQRFAPFIKLVFPETEKSNGLIESVLSPIDSMRETVEKRYKQKIDGQFFLKRDDLLPIAGTIKARGAIYEVLLHAEELALSHGLLKSIDEDYTLFASEPFKKFFSTHNITVGTTGNLGISVGTMGAKLGFEVTVHMSVDAKDWKKEFLRDRGVEVIEHQTNFTQAVAEGRKQSEENPNSYFVDDEHSVALFLGYAAGGYRMKKQLADLGIKVDQDNPLFVYLPCGIGGSPGGITFGMKQAFGDHLHCFFAEPAKMPSMLVGLASQKFDGISVSDVGLGGRTVADGLAVPRTSGLVSKIMTFFFSGGYTLDENEFKVLQHLLYDEENIFLEPAAVAGLSGPARLLGTEVGKHYLDKHQLWDKMNQATHIAWATGGALVPQENREEFLKEAKEAAFKSNI